MTQRIGVMGGMFDPVHCGHLEVARAACDVLALDRLLLVPCARPNHRQAASADAGQRLHMLRLATAEEARLQVDDREIQRPGLSYAADTVASVAAEWPAAQRVFVLGSDSFATLTQWHRWQDLLLHSHLCVVSRPGAPALSPALEQLLQQRRCATAEQLFTRPAGGIYLLDSLTNPISSTAVRDALVSGSLPPEWLPPMVAAYIRQHGLY